MKRVWGGGELRNGDGSLWVGLHDSCIFFGVFEFSGFLVVVLKKGGGLN